MNITPGVRPCPGQAGHNTIGPLWAQSSSFWSPGAFGLTSLSFSRTTATSAAAALLIWSRRSWPVGLTQRRSRLDLSGLRASGGSSRPRTPVGTLTGQIAVSGLSRYFSPSFRVAPYRAPFRARKKLRNPAQPPCLCGRSCRGPEQRLQHRLRRVLPIAHTGRRDQIA
jgi:hypothetical protein